MSGSERAPMAEAFSLDTPRPQSQSQGMPMNYSFTFNAYNPITVAEAFPTPISAEGSAANVMPFGHNNVKHNTNMQRKKRGRPRKYGPDGTMATGMSTPVLDAVPISQYAPPPPPPAADDATGGVQTPFTSNKKRGRPAATDFTYAKKKQRVDDFGASGVGIAPHVLIVQAGEDISTKIKLFSENGPRSICILSAVGLVSSATLRKAAYGETITHEGRFEIISLSGSFLLNENSDQHSRTGALNISLSSSDGRVLAGSVAGLLIAASPIQIVVGSFTADGSKEPKTEMNNEFSGRPQL